MESDYVIKGEMLNKESMRRTIARISHEIVEKNDNLNNVILLGIKTRGEFLAKRIRDLIFGFEGVEVICGAIDISAFRDDLQNDVTPKKPDFTFNIVGKDIILVDDVLFTGRTVRAAIEAVMKAGRPHSIQLAVLIDRGHRELPIRADFVGKNMPTSHTESVKVMLTEVDKKDKIILTETK